MRRMVIQIGQGVVEDAPVEEVGGKAAQLHRASLLGFNVPRGCGITPFAFELFVSSNPRVAEVLRAFVGATQYGLGGGRGGASRDTRGRVSRPPERGTCIPLRVVRPGERGRCPAGGALVGYARGRRLQQCRWPVHERPRRRFARGLSTSGEAMLGLAIHGPRLELSAGQGSAARDGRDRRSGPDHDSNLRGRSTVLGECRERLRGRVRHHGCSGLGRARCLRRIARRYVLRVSVTGHDSGRVVSLFGKRGGRYDRQPCQPLGSLRSRALSGPDRSPRRAHLQA